MIALSVVIGVVGGLGAVGFHYLINGIKILFFGSPAGEGFIGAIQALPWYYRIAVPAIGGLIVGPVITYLVKEAKGHGVPEVMEAVALKSGKIRPLVAPLKALVSAICIGTGGAAGREGPIVQIGSSFGSSVGQFLKLSPKKTETLLGAGAAAGIAGTFNAPLAGVIFSIEVLLKDIEMDSFAPIIVASVVGTVIANLFFGLRKALLHVPEYYIVSFWEFIPYIGLGVLAAIVALLFSSSLYSLEHLFEKIKFPSFLKPALGGLLLGSLALWVPQVHSTGYPVMVQALHGYLPITLVITLMLTKILATDLTLGSGGSGGIFAPSLFIGAMLGSAYGGLLHSFFPDIVAGAGSYGIVAMGAVFAGAAHAPLTAIIILFEMTREPMIFLPLMFACIISTVITSRFQDRNIYTTKLLNRGIDIDSFRETSILRNISVRDVMDTDPVVLEASCNIRVAKDIFKKAFYSHLPVIEEKTGNFLGMLNSRQILSFSEAENENLQVKDITFPSPASLSENDDLMKALKLTSKIKLKYLPVIEKNEVVKLKGIISRKDILEAYHKEVSGKLPEIKLEYSHHEDTEVERMIKFALKSIEKQAAEKQVNILSDIQEGLPPVSVDAHKICWVITNLLGNAVRYTRSGDDIKISAYRKKDMVYLSVSDSGPGIPEKNLEKIFKKYMQLDSKEEGKGLGLSISRDIIEDHGGRIWAESEMGAGTTFTFTLKTLPENEEEPESL